MQLRIASDLHLEFNAASIPVLSNEKEQVLVLAGDIAPLATHRPVLTTFLDECKERFKAVVYVLGNHEFYYGDLTMSTNFLDGVHVLRQNTVEIDGVVFVGDTLWTDMNKEDWFTLHTAQSCMADFIYIQANEQPFSARDSVVLHKKALSYFEGVLAQKQTKECVVVSHHAPSYLSVADRFKGDALNGSFVSDLSQLILDYQPTLWVHGHVHNHFDYMIGDTRVVCNPRGYPREISGFIPDFVVTLD